MNILEYARHNVFFFAWPISAYRGVKQEENVKVTFLSSPGKDVVKCIFCPSYSHFICVCVCEVRCQDVRSTCLIQKIVKASSRRHLVAINVSRVLSRATFSRISHIPHEWNASSASKCQKYHHDTSELRALSFRTINANFVVSRLRLSDSYTKLVAV